MPRQTPENDFMRQVMDLARLRGWKLAHFGASVRVVGKNRSFVGDRDSAGFPDLVLVKGERLVIVELKAPKGTVSDTQKSWLCALGETDAEVYLWRPEDWPEIEKVLK